MGSCNKSVEKKSIEDYINMQQPHLAQEVLELKLIGDYQSIREIYYICLYALLQAFSCKYWLRRDVELQFTLALTQSSYSYVCGPREQLSGISLSCNVCVIERRGCYIIVKVRFVCRCLCMFLILHELQSEMSMAWWF